MFRANDGTNRDGQSPQQVLNITFELLGCPVPELMTELVIEALDATGFVVSPDPSHGFVFCPN